MSETWSVFNYKKEILLPHAEISFKLYLNYLNFFICLCIAVVRDLTLIDENYISRVTELQFFKLLLHQNFSIRVTHSFQLIFQISVVKKEVHTSCFNMEEKIWICVSQALVLLDLMTVNYKIFQSAIFFKKPETNLEREWTCSNFAFTETKTRTLFLFHSCFIL